MGFDWGGFAGGIAKTWDSEKAGERVREKLLSNKVKAAEENHQKAVDVANAKTMKTEDGKGQALKLSDAQIAKMSPEAQAHFNKYYDQQAQAGNAGEYKYDHAVRSAGVKAAEEQRDAAIRAAYLEHKSPEEAEKYFAQRDKTAREAIETQTLKDYQDTITYWNSGEALTDEKNINILNATKAFMSYADPSLARGEFAYRDGVLGIQDGDKFNPLQDGMKNIVTGMGAMMATYGKTGDPTVLTNMLSVLGDIQKKRLGNEYLAIRKAEGGIRPVNSASSTTQQNHSGNKKKTAIPVDENRSNGD